MFTISKTALLKRRASLATELDLLHENLASMSPVMASSVSETDMSRIVSKAREEASLLVTKRSWLHDEDPSLLESSTPLKVGGVCDADGEVWVLGGMTHPVVVFRTASEGTRGKISLSHIGLESPAVSSSSCKLMDLRCGFAHIPINSKNTYSPLPYHVRDNKTCKKERDCGDAGTPASATSTPALVLLASLQEEVWRSIKSCTSDALSS